MLAQAQGPESRKEIVQLQHQVMAFKTTVQTQETKIRLQEEQIKQL